MVMKTQEQIDARDRKELAQRKKQKNNRVKYTNKNYLYNINRSNRIYRKYKL